MVFLSKHSGAVGCNLGYLLAVPSLKFKMFLLDTSITANFYTVSVWNQVSSASIRNYYLETQILEVNSLCKHYKQQCHAKIFTGEKKKTNLKEAFPFYRKYILGKFNNLNTRFILRLLNIYIAFPSLSAGEI